MGDLPMAGNQLAVIQGGGVPEKFAKEMALAYASIVGCSADQGMGVALTGYCEGLNPVEFKRRYHWIPGKGPSMRADAMLAEFRMNYGGKYKIVKADTESASIIFTDKEGNDFPRAMSRRNLLLSRNPWKKDPGWQKMVPQVQQMIAGGSTDDQIIAALGQHIGDNYGTPFDWENMLFARLVSQSLRKICPELAAGIYTPEEMSDVIEGEVVALAKPAKTVDQLLDEAAKPSATQQVKDAANAVVGAVVDHVASTIDDEQADPNEPALDAEFEVKSDASAEKTTIGNINRILELVKKIWPDKPDQDKAIEGALARRKKTALSLLSPDEAKELIDKLESMANPQ
jgi:hypothetical protein